ncbi:MAG: D-alanine--D-alanine ligase [Planctomycetota bacterium]
MKSHNQQPGRQLRVTVLRGGPSAERDISLASGQAVAQALEQRGHLVFAADILPNDLSALDHPADVVFPVLHGTFGEDGTLQRILEQRGLPFVGSGSEASALAMDKVASKQRVLDLGFDTPPFEVWTAETRRQRSRPELALPVVVKPADQGSSVATFVITQAAQFSDAVQQVVEDYERALVEQFISGDELTVGILDKQPLPPIFIRPKRQFYDFEAKYEDAATEYLFDAGHTPELLARASSQSRAVFMDFACRHLSRIDWIVDRDERLWFLEVNTIPGFTSHSLTPKAAARLGIPFDELVERLALMPLRESS